MAVHSIYSITILLFYTRILYHKKQSVCNSLLCRGWQEISKVLMQHFSKTWWLTHQDSASSMLLQSSVRTLTFYPKGKWTELSIELDNKKAITYSEFWYFSPRFLRLMLQSRTEKKSTRGYLPDHNIYKLRRYHIFNICLFQRSVTLSNNKQLFWNSAPITGLNCGRTWLHLTNKIKQCFWESIFSHCSELRKQKWQDFFTAWVKIGLHFVQSQIGAAVSLRISEAQAFLMKMLGTLSNLRLAWFCSDHAQDSFFML